MCASNPCQNSGTCVPSTVGMPGYKCSCLTGYTGINCEIIPPPPNLCSGNNLASSALTLGNPITSRPYVDISLSNDLTFIQITAFSSSGFLVGFQLYANAAGSVSLGLYHVSGTTFIPKQLWYQLPVPVSGSNTVRDIGKHVSLIDVKLLDYIHMLDYPA